MSNLEETIEKLPAYLHDEDEENRLYLFISRDIRGKWNASYETEGRHYHAVTGPTLLEVLTALTDLVATDSNANTDLSNPPKGANT